MRARSLNLACQVFSCAIALRISVEVLTTADSANPTFIVFVQLPNGEKIELPMGSTDTMMEVRQFLLDAPQSCCTAASSLLCSHSRAGITSYSLHFNGQELDDATELSSLGPALSAKPVIMMKELPYNEHSARIHVRRLRGTCSLPVLKATSLIIGPQSCLRACRRPRSRPPSSRSWTRRRSRRRRSGWRW